MGWTSSKTRHHINMIKLWNKFINMDENRITKCVFNLDYHICKNWSLELKDILYSTGLNQIYDNNNICNIDATKCICANLRNTDWKTIYYHSHTFSLMIYIFSIMYTAWCLTLYHNPIHFWELSI